MDPVGGCDLEGLFAEGLTPETRSRFVSHLISGCPSCTARLQQTLDPSPTQEDDYDAPWERAVAAIRPLAARVVDERERRDKGAARVQAKGWSRLTRAEREVFRGRWAEVELLLDLSFKARFRSPELMLRLAKRADDAAGRLPAGDPFPEALLFDLRARAAAELSNAERVNEHFLRSDEAVAKARLFLEQGTGDIMLRARVDDVEASLRRAQRRLEEAEALLGRAYRAYMRLGEHHLAGRILIKKGYSRRLADKPSEAAAILRRALSLLDPIRDPQPLASAHGTLIDCLVDAGRFREANETFLKSGLRKAFADDPLNLLRVDWIEGKILCGRKRFEDAARVLTRVRDDFRARGLEYVAAIAAVDLAKVYLQAGKLGDLHDLALELLHRSRDRRLHRPVQEALHCFELLCRHRVATVLYMQRVKSFLEEAQHRPSLTFHLEQIVGNP
jgi:tetratricopeptide (TPR) repeat protein